MATKKNMPDAAMPLGDKRSYGMGMGVDAGPEHGSMMGANPQPANLKPSAFNKLLPSAS